MSSFAVSVHREKALRDRMLKLGIREIDIVESFIRAPGPGGQHVNKVATAVYLKHAPSGIEVKCATERSQSHNRFAARLLLVDKMEEALLARALAEIQRLEKARRQTRRRSKKAKEKMLARKRRHSEKKARRKKVDLSSD